MNDLRIGNLKLVLACLIGVIGLTSHSQAAVCVHTASIVKAASTPITAPGTATIRVTLTTCTGSVNECNNLPGGTPCPSPALVTGGSMTVKLKRVGSNPVEEYVSSPTTIPSRGTRTGRISEYVDVPVTIPTTAHMGVYSITATGSVTFGGDTDGANAPVPVSGDSEVSYVPSVAGQPGVPRLGVKVKNGAATNGRLGQNFLFKVRIKNNETVPAEFTACMISSSPRKKGIVFPVVLFPKFQLPGMSLVSNKSCLPQKICLDPGKSTTIYGWTLPKGMPMDAGNEYIFRVKGEFKTKHPCKADAINTSVGASLVTRHCKFPWPWCWW